MKKELQPKDQELRELPIATMVIEEYKTMTKSLKRAVKILGIISTILLVLFAIETTYIIIYWDSLHPHAGAIRVES